MKEKHNTLIDLYNSMNMGYHVTNNSVSNITEPIDHDELVATGVIEDPITKEIVDDFKYPTDSIDMTDKKLCDMISSIWFHDDMFKAAQDGDLCIPTDLIIQKTIPLEHFEMILDIEIPTKYAGLIHISKANTRMYNMSDEFYNNIDEYNEDKKKTGFNMAHLAAESIVDVTFTHYKTGKKVMRQLKLDAFIDSDDLNTLYIDEGYLLTNSNVDDGPMLTYDELCWFGDYIMGLGYGIQLALLHPYTKELFATPHHTKVFNTSSNKHKKGRMRPVKRIKYHIINVSDFESKIGSCATDSSTTVRKTMLWHVAGFYRKSSNGKLHFVKGHWRGPLRHLKDSTETPTREREISIDTENNNVC